MKENKKVQVTLQTGKKQSFQNKKKYLSKYYFKCSTSLCTKESHFKTIVKFDLSIVITAKIKKQTVIWKGGTLIHCLWKCKLEKPLGKLVWGSSRKARDMYTA